MHQHNLEIYLKKYNMNNGEDAFAVLLALVFVAVCISFGGV